MDERQKLQHLFQFDLWCSHKLVNLFQSNEPFREQEACEAFLSHIINAQKIWFNRVIRLPADDDLDTWTEYLLNEMKLEAEEATQLWIDLIGDHEIDLNSRIHYKNSQGVDFSNELWQICNHLIIHGQHHRAQISIFLRNCDINPPSIDYIHFARSGLATTNIN
jgi:uncharacterized damage-inducible protein DinB